MPATITSPQPKSIYANSGKNLAPRGPLLRLAENKPTYSPNKLCDTLRNKYLEFVERDDNVWREILQEGQIVSNMTQGKLQLLRNVFDGRPMFVKRDTRFNDNKTVGGLFQFYMTKLDGEWLSSRPERDPVCPSDDDQIEEFISSVKVVQDFYDRKFFTTSYELEECDSAKCFGTWVTRYRYDPAAEDIICELLPFPACRWDIRFTAENSSYFIFESKQSTAELKMELNAEILSDGDDDISFGLQIMSQIAKRGGSVQGQGKDHPYGLYNNVQGETKVTEMWLSPAQYCDIELDDDEETLSGTTLKKGLTLLEQFPDGMCVKGINSMQHIIGLYPECHKDHIVSGRYHFQSYSGVGKGVSDAVDVKRDMDKFHSQKIAYLDAHATPATYYNQDLISEQKAKDIGKPRKVIPVDFKNAPDGVTRIDQAVQAITPSNPAQGIWEMGSVLEDHLQMAFQVTNFSSALPGVNNKTATGAQIGQELAQQMLVPQHLNKADHRRRSDIVIYNLFKKFVQKQKWFESKDLNPITRGRYLSGSAFDGVDIDFQIVSNSEIPRTPRAQEESLTRMAMAFPNFFELAAANPEAAGDIASAFGAKVSLPKADDVARICRKRVEQAKKILELELKNQQVMEQTFQQMGMPMPPLDNANLAEQIVSQLSPPISPMEPFAQQKAAWFGKLLDNDELQYAPVELRFVVEELIKWTLAMTAMGQGQIESFTNAGSLLANAPMLLAEQVASRDNQMMLQQGQQAEQQAQMEQMQAQGAQQLQLKAAEAEISEKQAGAAEERSEASSEKAHQRALQLKSMEMLQQQKLAKESAKGASK